MRKRIALLAAIAASGLGAMAVTAPQALAASCSSAGTTYADDPAVGYFTYGQNINCNSRINTYDVVTCLVNNANGQNIACHEAKGTAGWSVYSLSFNYQVYAPGVTAHEVGRWGVTFK